VKFARDGYTIVPTGHKDHDEVIGTLGEAPAAHFWYRLWRM
jgi:4-hydroxy-3-methylbut-2-enyl diphosphate reductase